VADGFRVTPPSFRFDIEIEEDLIEEIARLHGYDNIPSTPPVARMAMMPASESRKSAMALRRQIAARDFHEVVTYSFVEAAWETDFAANARPVVLANPIASQMGVMRSSLVGGLVDTLAANRKRQIERVRVFEIGRCFCREAGAGPVDGFAQPLRLGALAAGPVVPEQWGTATRRVDFYDVKADVEDLFAPRRLEFVKVAHPALHPGRCAEIRLAGVAVGVIGELHPRWVQKYELGTAPVLFEVELPALLSTPFPAYVEVSRLPAVVRDLALVVPQTRLWHLCWRRCGLRRRPSCAMWLYSMCITARASPMAKKALPSG
jgi:phenylalanyl-tRNA synthetase beta chain